MLTIDAGLLDAIVAHARRDHPDEACGIVWGPAGTDVPTNLIPMENAARSMTFYEFDSQEYLRVWRERDDRDEQAQRSEPQRRQRDGHRDHEGRRAPGGRQARRDEVTVLVEAAHARPEAPAKAIRRTVGDGGLFQGSIMALRFGAALRRGVRL